MALFMTRKKREQIGDQIDDLLMRQYHHRCKHEERAQHEKNKIEEEELQIQKLRKKLA